MTFRGRQELVQTPSHPVTINRRRFTHFNPAGAGKESRWNDGRPLFARAGPRHEFLR